MPYHTVHTRAMMGWLAGWLEQRRRRCQARLVGKHVRAGLAGHGAGTIIPGLPVPGVYLSSLLLYVCSDSLVGVSWRWRWRWRCAFPSFFFFFYCPVVGVYACVFCSLSFSSPSFPLCHPRPGETPLFHPSIMHIMHASFFSTRDALGTAVVDTHLLPSLPPSLYRVAIIHVAHDFSLSLFLSPCVCVPGMQIPGDSEEGLGREGSGAPVGHGGGQRQGRESVRCPRGGGVGRGGILNSAPAPPLGVRSTVGGVDA